MGCPLTDELNRFQAQVDREAEREAYVMTLVEDLLDGGSVEVALPYGRSKAVDAEDILTGQEGNEYQAVTEWVWENLEKIEEQQRREAALERCL